jgi:hypothetical protein
VAQLNGLPPGGTVRRARLVALAMDDPRIVDAQITLVASDGVAREELTLESGEVLEVTLPVQFAPPLTEEAVTTQVDVRVSVRVPVHLTPGTTRVNAQQAIDSALASHLATRAADAPLTLDGVAAAIRDDTRFALVRAEALLVVEAGDRFFQLTDGVGAYAPAPSERLRLESVDLDVREGSV